MLERTPAAREAGWERSAQLLKVLGHPVRLRIVAGLACGDCNVLSIWQCLDLPQPTVSQHLRILRREGVVEAERQGKEMIYRVTDPRVFALLHALEIGRGGAVQFVVAS